VLGQRLLDGDVASSAVGAVVGREVHPVGADLARRVDDEPHRLAGGDTKTTAESAQIGIQ
jgi:hypothetical protein